MPQRFGLNHKLLVVAIVACGTIHAASAMTCDITAYGASVTATPQANAAAVKSAFSACSSLGTVQVPVGVFPMIGIELEYLSDVTLNFSDGGYLAQVSQSAGQGNPIIEVKHASVLTVSTSGVGGFNGAGSSWWGTPQANNAPALLEIKDSSSVVVSGVIFNNPAGTALSLKQCTSIHVTGISVVATPLSAPTVGKYTNGVVLKDGVTSATLNDITVAGVQGYCIQVRGGLGSTCAASVFINGTRCEGAGFAVGPVQNYGVGSCITGVDISNSVVSSAQTGVLIAAAPTTAGASGSYISGVTVSKTFLGATLPVNITQNAYINNGGGPPATPEPLKISGITLQQLTGGTAGGESLSVTCDTSSPCQVVMANSRLQGSMVCGNATILGSGNTPPISAACA